MASIGVPGTNGFVGEFMVIVGTYYSEHLAAFSGLQAAGAAFGVILAAVYMLGAVQKMFFGPLKNPKNKHLTDISPREMLALSPLIIFVFIIGFFPRMLLEPMKPTVAAYYNQFNRMLDATTAKNLRSPDDARLMPTGVFGEGFLDMPKPEAPAPEKAAAADTTDDGGKLAAGAQR